MLIDIYNGVEKRTGRTADSEANLQPGEYRLCYLLVPLSRNGKFLIYNEGTDARLLSGTAPAGQSSLAAALDEARRHLGPSVLAAGLRLMTHEKDAQASVIRDVYLVFSETEEALSEKDRWLLPEEILADPSLTACLRGDPFFQEQLDTLSRISGETRVPPGIWQDQKGTGWEVIGIAAQAATHMPLVICRRATGDRGLCAFPASRFAPPRFRLISQPE